MLVMVLFGASLAIARDAGTTPIGLDVTVSAVSEYNFYGYDVFDDTGVWSIEATYQVPKLPIIGKGLFIGAKSFSPLSDGFSEQLEIDYTIGYKFSLFKKTPAQINTTISYTYLDLVKQDSDADIQELKAAVALPNFIKVLDNPLVPRAAVVNLISDGPIDGMLYIFGVDYTIPIFKQPIKLGVDVTYNDSIADVRSGWSHYTLGASTDFAITKNITLTPTVNYQISQKDRVNNEDSLYGGVAVKISF